MSTSSTRHCSPRRSNCSPIDWPISAFCRCNSDSCGIAGGLFGGLLSGSAGIASGAAVTFASTYALGHAAEQYYARGRSLSSTDLKALFTGLRADAVTIFPQVEARVGARARGRSMNSVLRTVTR